MLELVERPVPEPGADEVRVRVLVSGVNPTDRKSRSGAFGGMLAEPTVPNHDGASLRGNELYTWVVTAYLLSSTFTVPTYGKLSDIYG